MDEIAQFKQTTRAIWARGDYHIVAELIWDVGAHVTSRVDVGRGDEVLDVACGTGNAAIAAANRGASVTGLDLTPELLDRARANARDVGVDVRWAEGDAEALPFDDESFDVVLSTFGCMFAPRHEVVARELARVLRPGGRLGLCTFPPDGTIGEFFDIVGCHLPAPPAFAAPPILWGDEEHVRALFDGSGIALELERAVVEERFASADAAADLYGTTFGPVMLARELLEAQGSWESLRSELVELFARHNRATNGTVVFPDDYLVVTGTKTLP
jgi:SAM-dependent methyltransferase